jgi:hypothetical protein
VKKFKVSSQDKQSDHQQNESGYNTTEIAFPFFLLVSPAQKLLSQHIKAPQNQDYRPVSCDQVAQADVRQA